MSEVVNLNRARKARRRAEESARATANRFQFCRSKTEKRRDEAEVQREAKELDGKKLE